MLFIRNDSVSIIKNYYKNWRNDKTHFVLHPPILFGGWITDHINESQTAILRTSKRNTLRLQKVYVIIKEKNAAHFGGEDEDVMA